jgi:hypothetical protein
MRSIGDRRQRGEARCQASGARHDRRDTPEPSFGISPTPSDSAWPPRGPRVIRKTVPGRTAPHRTSAVVEAHVCRLRTGLSAEESPRPAVSHVCRLRTGPRPGARPESAWPRRVPPRPCTAGSRGEASRGAPDPRQPAPRGAAAARPDRFHRRRTAAATSAWMAAPLGGPPPRLPPPPPHRTRRPSPISHLDNSAGRYTRRRQEPHRRTGQAGRDVLAPWPQYVA